MSDQSIAKKLGGLSKTSVRRHRVNHIERTARAILQAANRCRDTRAERDRVIAAAKAGNLDPTAYLSIATLTDTVRRIESRLERLAQSAEIAERHVAVAALSGQQLKAAAFAARLGSLGSFASPKSGPNEAPRLELRIIFRNGQEIIEATAAQRDDPEFNAASAMPLLIGSPDNPNGRGEAHVADQQNNDEDELDEDV